MTTSTINKYTSFLYDKKGKKVAVQLDLRNKLMKKVYENAMSQLEDLLESTEAESRLTDGTELIPWEEAKKNLYKPDISEK